MSIESIKAQFCNTEKEERAFDSMMPVFRHAVVTAWREEVIRAPEYKKICSDDVFNTFVDIAPSIIGSPTFGRGHEYLERKETYLKMDAEVMPLFFAFFDEVKQEPVMA